MRKRVLGPCRVTQYGGRWGLQFQKADHYYALMDWWFAAKPWAVKSFLDISHRWHLYKRRLMQLRIARWFSHYVWAIHVHDFLNATADIRFRPGVRVNLVRHSYNRLRMPAWRTTPLGEYVSDAVGNCDTLRTSDNRTLSAEALMRAPVDPTSALGQQFAGRYMSMAEQCAMARLEEPAICCGEPRSCGTHICGSDFSSANQRFFATGQAAFRRWRRDAASTKSTSRTI